MHSRHAKTATQEALDALANKSCLGSLTTVLTAAAQPTPKTSSGQPTLKTSAEPDAPLPNAPATAPVATEEWRITMGKAARRKAKAAEAKRKRMARPRDETPNETNGGRGKKAHQPTTNHHRHARTWADVVRSGGINVQIVLGNGSLGTTQPETGKKERRDGARDGIVHWLGRKREGGKRGGMQRGTGGPKKNHDDNGEGRRNKRQPSVATPVQTGHLGQMMRDGHKYGVNGVTGPTP
jgi:hypothetical protein